MGRQQRRLVAIAVAVPHSPQRTALGRQQQRRRHIAAIAVAIARSARLSAEAAVPRSASLATVPQAACVFIPMSLRTLFTDIPSLTHFRTLDCFAIAANVGQKSEPNIACC